MSCQHSGSSFGNPYLSIKPEYSKILQDKKIWYRRKSSWPCDCTSAQKAVKLFLHCSPNKTRKGSFYFLIFSSLKFDTYSFIDFCPLNINVIISPVLFSSFLAFPCLYSPHFLSFYISLNSVCQFLGSCVFSASEAFTLVYIYRA